MKHTPNRTRRPLTLAVMDRFLPNVDRSGACWLWTGKRDVDGYGVFYFDGGDYRAHRVAYEFAFDQAPGSKCVCHRCDNPSCVRPDHLFLGTSEENTADRNAKGRQARGRSVPQSKLSDTQVIEIRRALSTGAKQVAIARAYGVSQALISSIKCGIAWRHVE